MQPQWCEACWKDSLQANHLKFERFLSLFGSSEWRIGVVYREPTERFMPAYYSKCLLSDPDGRVHCHQLFGLRDDEISVEAVASGLKTHGRQNPHWAPQAEFCGGTVGWRWGQYTHRINFDNLTAGLLGLVQGRVKPETLTALRGALQTPVHGAKGH